MIRRDARRLTSGIRVPDTLVTVLTDERQALVWVVGIGGVPAPWAGFARIVGIHLGRYAARKARFVGEQAVQFGERPRGDGGVRFALFPAHLLPPLAPGLFPNACQQGVYGIARARANRSVASL